MADKKLKWSLRAALPVIGLIAVTIWLVPAMGGWTAKTVLVSALAVLTLATLAWTLTDEKPLSGTAAFILLASTGLLLVFGKDPMAFPEYAWDEEVHRDLMTSLLASESLSAFLGNLRTWDLGYLSAMPGWLLANAAGMPEEWARLLACGTHTLCYALICAFAVLETPKYKVTFLTVAMLPVCVFLSASFSYDTLLIACILLALALLLKTLCEDRDAPLPAGRMLAMTALLCLGTLPKPAYSPLLLLPLMIPAARFGGKGRKALFGVSVAVLLAWSLVSLKLPGIYDNVLAGDTRLDSNPDPEAQLVGVLADIPRALGITLGYFVSHLPQWFWTIGDTMGKLINDRAGSAACAVLTALSLTAVLPETEERPMSGKRRAAFFLLPCLCLFTLTVTQYMVSTAVGDTSVSGMQPRYLLPVLTMMLTALQLPEKARKWLRPAGRIIAAVVLGGMLVIHMLQAAGLPFPML